MPRFKVSLINLNNKNDKIYVTIKAKSAVNACVIAHKQYPAYFAFEANIINTTTEYNNMLTLSEIKNMTISQAIARGMRSWDGNGLYLIPLKDWPNWPNGVELTSILGEKVIKGKDYIDEDTRGGLLAFGIYPKNDNIKDSVNENNNTNS